MTVRQFVDDRTPRSIAHLLGIPHFAVQTLCHTFLPNIGMYHEGIRGTELRVEAQRDAVLFDCFVVSPSGPLNLPGTVMQHRRVTR